MLLNSMSFEKPVSLAKKMIVVSVAAIFLQACSQGSHSDLKQFVEDAYKDQKPEIEPLPIIEPYKGFDYSAEDENDPFALGNIANARDDSGNLIGQRADTNRRREHLEKFPLDALAMVGTMSQDGVPWVIVKTTTGTAHLATIGNYMGENEGKIREILPDEQRVVLVENVLDSAGRLISRDVEITIDEENE